MKRSPVFALCALGAGLMAGCTTGDDPSPAKAPNLLATLLPSDEIAYSGIGPDGTSVIGFGVGYPVLVKAVDGTVLDASHLDAAFAVATVACEGAGRNAPHPNGYDMTEGGIRYRSCG